MKQINKANQIISEKIGGAKGTELEGEFHIMEKRTDVIYRLIDDVRDRTNEYLQPNPASRAKLWTVNNLSKMRGQVKNTPYPQPEGTLGETMIRYGKDLGDESHFGLALTDMGESLRQMAGIKYALEDNIKQNFLDPLSQIKDNDLKEVLHLRKKTENRRLDYDCKKRKKSQGSAVTEEELQQAAEKFEESKAQTELIMTRLLNNEAEHITHLIGFAEGFLEYHHQCYEILKDMVKQLNEKKKKVAIMSKNYEIKKPLHNSEAGPGVAAYGSVKANSDGSSSASRIYDNGGDTSSSISDTFYADNNQAHNSKPTSQPAAASTNGKLMSSLNGIAESINNQLGFKLPYGAQQSSMNQTNSSRNSREPCCKALYDFEAENSEELESKEGNMIKLVARLDDNWLQGELNGRQGRFPVSYVDIIVPIP